jgi:hypothetical protein
MVVMKPIQDQVLVISERVLIGSSLFHHAQLQLSTLCITANMEVKVQKVPKKT